MIKLYLLCCFVFSTGIEACAQYRGPVRLLKPQYFLVVSKFGNNKPKPFTYRRNVYIRLRGQIVFPSDSLGSLVFRGLMATDTIDLVIKSGQRIFSLTKIAGWRFRDGAHVAIGTIPKLWKLKSIAEQDDYVTTDAEYAWLRRRYRISPEGTTVDLPAIDRLKRLTYINCCSYSGQCIMNYNVTGR